MSSSSSSSSSSSNQMAIVAPTPAPATTSLVADTSAPEHVRIIQGAWRRPTSPPPASSTASTSTSAPTPAAASTSTPRITLTPPPLVRVHDAPYNSTAVFADAIDTFFGDRRERARDAEALANAPPPPYQATDAVAPAYEVAGEPVTLAMYLFKYGFLFPPFWVLGSCILLTTLREPETWAATKSAGERAVLLAEIRRVECKWARRSLCALLVLVVLVVAAVLASVAVVRWA